MLPAGRHRRPMCSNAARLGWLCLMAARHQRGTAPLDARNQCGAQKAVRRFMPTGYSTTRHSGCSSPTRSQARHKNQTACGFYSAVGTIVPFVARTAGQHGCTINGPADGHYSGRFDDWPFSTLAKSGHYSGHFVCFHDRPEDSPSSMRSRSLLVKNRPFFKTLAAFAR